METHPICCCGLVQFFQGSSQRQLPVPLKSVDVKATVVQAVAQVEVTQVYVNLEKQPIEAVYYFPIDPEGAVTHFEANLDGKIIKGIVKPREEASKIYDKAVADKKTAVLGEETKADIFKVGYLKPGSQATIVIRYVTEVKNEPGLNALRFYVPTTVAPRYCYETEKIGVRVVLKAPPSTSSNVDDIKRMKFSTSETAPLSIKVDVMVKGGIRSIESATHFIKIERFRDIPGSPGWQKTMVEFIGDTTKMDKDFVLHIKPEDVHQLQLYSEKLSDNSTVMMLHMVPTFQLTDQQTELIFVLDRSGSMDGSSIKLAKRALGVFLRSMPSDCYFNVVGFGSTHEFLFPSSVKYNAKKLKLADDYTKKLDADLGGTELLTPLREIYGKPGIEGYLRQIFVLTDGQVFDTDAVHGIVHANAHQARVFSLGIGSAACHHLVEGLAKAGGGTSAFVSTEESFEGKVMNQLKNALQPSLTDITLKWEGENLLPDNSAENCKQAPKRIPPVHDGSQLLVFGMFRGNIPTAAVITAKSLDGELTFRAQHNPRGDNLDTSGMLHQLAAAKLVRELEMDEACAARASRHMAMKCKKEIILIGCEHGISSKYTSFVAVDTVTNQPLDKNWIMVSRPVASQIPSGQSAPRSARRQAPSYGGTVRPTKSLAKRSRNIARGGTAPNAGLASRSARRTAPSCGGAARPTKSLAESSRYGSRFVACRDMSRSSEPQQEVEPIPLVNQMISFQAFDGSYSLDKKLCEVLGKDVNDLKQAAVKNKLKENVLATALAISFFANKLSEEKEIWELVVRKSNKWLQMMGEAVSRVMQIATALLSN